MRGLIMPAALAGLLALGCAKRFEAKSDVVTAPGVVVSSESLSNPSTISEQVVIERGEAAVAKAKELGTPRPLWSEDTLAALKSALDPYIAAASTYFEELDNGRRRSTLTAEQIQSLRESLKEAQRHRQELEQAWDQHKQMAECLTRPFTCAYRYEGVGG